MIFKESFSCLLSSNVVGKLICLNMFFLNLITFYDLLNSFGADIYKTFLSASINLWLLKIFIFRWIEACIHEELPPTIELEEALTNGVICAKLANFFAPTIAPIRKIFDKDLTRYKVRNPFTLIIMFTKNFIETIIIYISSFLSIVLILFSKMYFLLQLTFGIC